MSFGSGRMGSPGISCGGLGIDRRLSGKPTKLKSIINSLFS